MMRAYRQEWEEAIKAERGRRGIAKERD